MSTYSTEYITIPDSTGVSVVDTTLSYTPGSMTGNYGVSMDNYGITQAIINPYPNYINYPNVIVSPSVQSFTPLIGSVKYTIYKLVYKLSYSSSEKELIFAHQSDEAPEIGIMKAADKMGLKFIEILSLEELETSEVFLLSNQKVKEIEL